MEKVEKIRGWANVYKEKASVMEYAIFVYPTFEAAEKQALGKEGEEKNKRVTREAVWFELEVVKK